MKSYINQQEKINVTIETLKQLTAELNKEN